MSPFSYEGPVRSLITAAKYHGNVRALRFLAGRIAKALIQQSAELDGFDVVSWAPTSPQRQRRRGFDQAQLLASDVAILLGIPSRRLLVYQRPTGTDTGSRPGSGFGPRSGAQTGLNRYARIHRGERFRCTAQVLYERVLLIDDVMTTGATLSAAARVLRDAGAPSVTAAVAAVKL